MDLQYSQADQDFRQRARAWLATNVPRQPRPTDGHAAAQFDRDWQRKMYDHGWAGVSWPKEFGGLGLSGLQQVIWYEELAHARAPHYINTTYISLMHAGPTLISRGTEEQKAFHLPRILNGDALWCQGFSEPNAGSDLASLKTRGRLDGDDIVVTGAKMWTTDAAHADYQELLIRTDPNSQRHKGLTWVICDMKLPGIDIKPIRTMLKDEHVNMVFYDEVRIPKSNVVGGYDQGWSTALATLSFERGIGFIGDQLELYERVGRAIDLAGKIRTEDGRLAIEDAGIAQKLASLKAEALAIRSMTLADIAETDRSGEPGPKGSMMKLLVTGTHKALSELVGDMLGWEFLEFDGDRTAHPWTYDYLWSWVFTISGGTSEIQRENIADRVLGLPRGAMSQSTEPAPLRIGFAGANAQRGWATDAHLGAIRALPGLAIQAVSARTQAIADDAAALYGAASAYDGSLALARDPDVDIVAVTVKVPEHRAIVLAAIAAGKHVYCEWPLGRDLAETIEMAEAARAAGVHVAIGLQGENSVAVRHAAKLLREGTIGRPLSLRVVSPTAGWGAESPAHYAYLQDKRNGATLSTIAGGHTLAAIEAVVGAYCDVSALSSILLEAMKVSGTEDRVARTCADHLIVTGRHESGCVSSLEVIGGVSDVPFRFELRGTAGALAITGGHVGGYQAGRLEVAAGPTAERQPLAAAPDLDGPPANVAELWARFESDIRNGTRTVPDFDRAGRLTRLLDTIDAASDQGRRLPVEY